MSKNKNNLAKPIKNEVQQPQKLSFDQLEQLYANRSDKLIKRYNALQSSIEDFGEFLQGFFQVQNEYLKALHDKMTELQVPMQQKNAVPTGGEKQQ